MQELAVEDPGILRPYFARVNARGGPTSLFSLNVGLDLTISPIGQNPMNQSFEGGLFLRGVSFGEM